MKIKDVSLIFLLSGLFILFIAVHNIDIAWNMNVLKDYWKYDMNLNKEMKTSTEIYIESMGKLIIGIIFIVVAFFLAFCL